jgi:hypothetical protein
MKRVSQTALVAIYGLLITLLVSCGFLQGMDIVIPDQYEGFLVIGYECPGGSQLVRKNGHMQVPFEDNGVLCVTNTYEDFFPDGIHSVNSVYMRNGQKVPFKGSSTDKPGYALVELQTMITIAGSTGTGERYVYSIFWVGEMEHFQKIIQEDLYQTELDTTLTTGFEHYRISNNR